MQTIQKSEPLFSNKALLRLIWPLVIEQGLAIAVGLADSIMVSSVGEAAVSGVSLVDMISILLINIFAALATGGAVVISQFVGARDPKTAQRATDQLVISTTALSLVITALVLLFRRSLLSLFFGKVATDVMDNCLTYIAITAPSYPFLALYNSSAAVFRAQGNSKVSMKVSFLMNGINVCGNALLIYGLKIGVAGVAIPTLVSRVVAALLMLALLRRESNPLRLSPLRMLRPDLSLIQRILTIGIPNAVENGMFQFGKIIVVSMIAGFSTAQISANAIAGSVFNINILMGQSISMAIVTVVGQCVGMQDLQQARGYGLKLTVLSGVSNTVTSLFVMLLLPFIMRLYQVSDETAGYIKQIMYLSTLGIPLFWCWSFSMPCALRAANDVKFTSTVAIISMWAVRVGLGYVFCVRMGYGVVGVWSAMVLDWALRAACYLPRFLRGGWKKHANFRPLTPRKP